MRKFALFASIFVWSLLFGNEDKPIVLSLLETIEINGEEIHFLKDKQEPYSGTSLGFFEKGEKQAEVNYKDGKKEGLATWWHENGQKDSEMTYNLGQKEGLEIQWHPNGQKN